MRDERTGPWESPVRNPQLRNTAAERKQARAWITGEGCTDGIMESTGTYGKPVFHLREGQVRVLWPIRRKGRRARGTRPTTRMPGGGPSVASRDGDGELDSAAPAARAAGPDAAPPPADPDRQRGENRLGKVVEDATGSCGQRAFRRFRGIRTMDAGSALGGPGGRCAEPLSRKPGRRKRFQTGSPHGKSTAGRIITAG